MAPRLGATFPHMRTMTTAAQRIRMSILARLEAHRAADSELEAFARVVNCPSCGDTNRNVLVDTLDAEHGVTRSICAAPVDDGIAICGCPHLYHAA
jgi:hypothetical protein